MIQRFNAMIAKLVPPVLVLIALLVAVVTLAAGDPVPAGLPLICMLLAVAGLLAQIATYLEGRK